MNGIAPISGTPPTPTLLGVGARFSLHPHTSDFVTTILDALSVPRPTALEVVTDDVSTFVRGTEADVVTYLRDAIAQAADTGAHVTAHVLLSRGCPGETAGGLGDEIAPTPLVLPRLEPTGHAAHAHWSLYPLDDGGPGGRGDHMTHIMGAIEHARDHGIHVRGEHLVTRLDGDLAEVLETVAGTWLAVGRHVRHVVTHVTISVGSPSVTDPAVGDAR